MCCKQRSINTINHSFLTQHHVLPSFRTTRSDGITSFVGLVNPRYLWYLVFTRFNPAHLHARHPASQTGYPLNLPLKPGLQGQDPLAHSYLPGFDALSLTHDCPDCPPDTCTRSRVETYTFSTYLRFQTQTRSTSLHGREYQTTTKRTQLLKKTGHLFSCLF